ncbi:MAG: radical SAM protein [Candidatus Omnitrophica bacterium]|nr:radical SAM protein [Candidatus Omnitrophota bacterium]
MKKRIFYAGMFVRRIAQSLLSPNRLSHIVLFLTHRCNAHCSFCFNTLLQRHSSQAVDEELSLEEYVKIAQNNKPLFQVIFGGGEPFLREDIVEIAKSFYRYSSARLFSIPTNGSLAQDILHGIGIMVQECPKAVFNIEIAIDAVGKKHDELRQVPGLFKKVITLCHDIIRIQKCYQNLNLVFNTTVSEYNIDTIIQLRDFLREEFGSSLKFHNVMYDCRASAKLFSNPEMVEKVVTLKKRFREKNSEKFQIRKNLITRYYSEFINNLLINQRLKKGMLYKCNAGKKIGVVLPNGEISPCEPFIFESCYNNNVFPRYNLRDYHYDYKAITRGQGFQKILQFIDNEKCYPCGWSCAAITSMLYSPQNWKRLFTNKDMRKIFLKS